MAAVEQALIGIFLASADIARSFTAVIANAHESALIRLLHVAATHVERVAPPRLPRRALSCIGAESVPS